MPTGKVLVGIGIGVILLGIGLIASTAAIPTAQPPEREHKSFTVSTRSGYLIPVDANPNDILRLKAAIIGGEEELFFSILKPDGKPISDNFFNKEIKNAYTESVILTQSGTYLLVFDNKHSTTVAKGVALTIEITKGGTSIPSEAKAVMTPIGSFFLGNGVILSIAGFQSRKGYIVKWDA